MGYEKRMFAWCIDSDVRGEEAGSGANEPDTLKQKYNALVKQMTVTPQVLSGGAALTCKIEF